MLAFAATPLANCRALAILSSPQADHSFYLTWCPQHVSVTDYAATPESVSQLDSRLFLFSKTQPVLIGEAKIYRVAAFYHVH